MTACKAILCIDAGGTFFKYTCFDRDGNMLFPPCMAAVNSQGGRDEIIRVYANIFKNVSEKYDILSIGIATPGPFDYNACESLMTHKFKSLYKINLKNELCSSLGRELPISFMSDTNAFLLGSYDGAEPCIGITIGTGLGMAVMSGGRLITNSAGGPCEVIYNKPAEGGKTVEDYVSGRGISEMYSSYSGEKLSAKEISVLARGGNEKAMLCFNRLGAALGTAVNEYVAKYNAEKIILGGQVSKSGDLFSDEMQKHITRKLQISVSVEDNAALLGIFKGFGDINQNRLT